VGGQGFKAASDNAEAAGPNLATARRSQQRLGTWDFWELNFDDPMVFETHADWWFGT